MPCLRSALVVRGVEVGRRQEGHLARGRSHTIILVGNTLKFSVVYGLQLRRSSGHGGVHVVGQQQSNNWRDHRGIVGGSVEGGGAVRGLSALVVCAVLKRASGRRNHGAGPGVNLEWEAWNDGWVGYRKRRLGSLGG